MFDPKHVPCVGVYAISNTQMPGVEGFYGAPFLARDDETAKQMVKESLKDVSDQLNADAFHLCRLGDYNTIARSPLFVYDVPELVCSCGFIFVEEVEDAKE